MSRQAQAVNLYSESENILLEFEIVYYKLFRVCLKFDSEFTKAAIQKDEMCFCSPYKL